MGLDYIADKDIAGNAASSIIGETKNAVVSTGADFLSTIWNSTVGFVGGPEMSTADVLTKVDKDALSFYNEHREGVEGASFMAGIIAPQAATIKLLGLAKNGVSVLGKSNSVAAAVGDVFSGSKAQALSSELRVMLENAVPDTTAYNKTMYKLYAAKIGENAIDSAIFEMATVGVLNAHPYMEDYMQSPYTNFALWAGIGAGIGAPLAYISANTMIREALGPTALAAKSLQNKMIVPVNPAMPNGAKIQTLNITIANGEALLEDVGLNELNKTGIADVLLITRGEKIKRIEEAASWLAPKLDKNGKTVESEFIELKPVVTQILSMPEMLAVHQIKLPNMKFVPKGKGQVLELEVEMLEKPTKEFTDKIKLLDEQIARRQSTINQKGNKYILKDDLEFATDQLRQLKEQREVLIKEGSTLKTVFYHPASGTLMDRDLAGRSANASNLKGYKVNAKTVNIYADSQDMFMTNILRETPAAIRDARYLEELHAWSKVEAKNIANARIATDDLPRLNAAVSMLSGKTAEFLETAQFRIPITKQKLPSGLQVKEMDGLKGKINQFENRLQELNQDISANKIHADEVRWNKEFISSDGLFVGEIKTAKDVEKEIALSKQELNKIQDSLKETKKTVNGFELINHYTNETERQIKEFVKDGSFAPEEIAARLNTTKEAVLLVGSGRNLDEIPNWARYTDASKIESEYLNPKNRILALQGNPNTIRASQMSGNLDTRFLNIVNTTMIENYVAASKNKMANEVINLYNPLDDPATVKAMHWWVDQLGASLGEVNNVLIGSPFFSSLDHALRHIQGGPLVTFIGKEASKLGDRITKRLLTPMAESFKGLGSSNVALTEYLVADNKRLSLSGWKDFRTDAETGFRYIVQREIRDVPDATGKMVKQTIEVPVKNADGSVYYIKTAEASNALDGTVEAANELLGMHNLLRKIRGEAPLSDIGAYVPPPNLTNKFFSYVFDNTGKAKPSVLYADTAKELAGLEAAYKQAVIKGDPTIQIISRGEQLEQFNRIHGYMDGDPFLTSANVNLKHSGASASAIIASDARRINEIMEGFNHQILTATRKLHEMYLGDIMQKLDIFSQINQKHYSGQPLRGFFKEKAQDAAMTVKNGLLGVNNLNQFTTWKTVNEFVDMAIVKTSRAIDATTGLFKDNLGSREHWEAHNRDLTAAGIKTPFESFQLYEASLIGSSTVNSKRLIAAQNGLLGTMILRLLEMGQPIVNAISLPVLTNSAIMSGLPKTFLSNGAEITLPLRLPMDAMRFEFNPKGLEAVKRWEAAGDINQVTRQFSDLAGELQITAVSKGSVNKMLDKVESFQSSRAMEILSTPSDFVEKWSRKQAMLTGYLGAKTAYPGISDRGADIFAVAFADRSIGNYHSQQRPVMFQGTAGSALGLFQTYMLSFAQSVYRHIEERQFKALATTMLTQAGIFGMASWPGYNQLSTFIGEHMSNQNYDLTTGTYRAVGHPMAEVVLYGLPSMMGPSLYTRGDIAPRIPAAMSDLAIVNSTVGVYNAVGKMMSSVVNQPGFAGKLQGMMEGLSLQSVSRPIARASEIVAGESITRKGQTVSTSDDVWTFNGIASRLLSVRPLEEQVTRNALNLNSYYGAADYDNRQKAVGKLRTAIRANDMSDELVETVAQEYIRHGGSNKGWTSVMNEIMSRTEEGTSYDLMRKLEPNSPLRRMLKDTF